MRWAHFSRLAWILFDGKLNGLYLGAGRVDGRVVHIGEGLFVLCMFGYYSESDWICNLGN